MPKRSNMSRAENFQFWSFDNKRSQCGNSYETRKLSIDQKTNKELSMYTNHLFGKFQRFLP